MKDSVKKVAVLMTCYNRREKTLRCLDSLFGNLLNEGYSFKVFLVDDGSTDGTGEAVNLKYPDVEILKGDGTLFWCGGMNLAFGKALSWKYDFYMWLNDDTILNKNALEVLFGTYFLLYEQLGRDLIVVGSVCDKETKELTYGGSRRGKWWKPLHYEMIQPSKVPQQCDLFHGNCLLIPHNVAEATGNMSTDYKQGPGDIDYARRAARRGFALWICAGFVGTCSRNTFLEKWRDKNILIKERVEALKKPVVVARTKDWVIYTKKYHKILFPYYWAISLIRLHFPRLYLFLKTLS